MLPLIALFGMATKYAEAVCAVTYREVDAEGKFIVTKPNPVPEPAVNRNQLGNDTEVDIEQRGPRQLRIAQIDGKNVETRSPGRCPSISRL